MININTARREQACNIFASTTMFNQSHSRSLRAALLKAAEPIKARKEIIIRVLKNSLQLQLTDFFNDPQPPTVDVDMRWRPGYISSF